MSISVSQFLPLHPLSPLGVHTFVPYGSVSISALQTRSFKITEIVSFERSEIIVILKKKKKTFPQNGCYSPQNFHVDFESSLISIRSSLFKNDSVSIYTDNHFREIHVSDNWLSSDSVL